MLQTSRLLCGRLARSGIYDTHTSAETEVASRYCNMKPSSYVCIDARSRQTNIYVYTHIWSYRTTALCIH